jgi:hypothetical protein
LGFDANAILLGRNFGGAGSRFSRFFSPSSGSIRKLTLIGVQLAIAEGGGRDAMIDGDEKGNWALLSVLRVTEAVAVAAIDLAGALFANWVRPAGIGVGIRAPSRIDASSKCQQPYLQYMGGDSMIQSEERIREIAYFLWESEGRPDDRAELHWRAAEAIVAAEDAKAQEKVVDPSPREVSPAERHADAA